MEYYWHLFSLTCSFAYILHSAYSFFLVSSFLLTHVFFFPLFHMSSSVAYLPSWLLCVWFCILVFLYSCIFLFCIQIACIGLPSNSLQPYLSSTLQVVISLEALWKDITWSNVDTCHGFIQSLIDCWKRGVKNNWTQPMMVSSPRQLLTSPSILSWPNPVFTLFLFLALFLLCECAWWRVVWSWTSSPRQRQHIDNDNISTTTTYRQRQHIHDDNNDNDDARCGRDREQDRRGKMDRSIDSSWLPARFLVCCLAWAVVHMRACMRVRRGYRCVECCLESDTSAGVAQWQRIWLVIKRSWVQTSAPARNFTTRTCNTRTANKTGRQAQQQQQHQQQ